MLLGGIEIEIENSKKSIKTSLKQLCFEVKRSSFIFYKDDWERRIERIMNK